MSLQKYRFDETGSAQTDGGIPLYVRWQGGRSLAGIRNCRSDHDVIPPRTVYVQGEADTYYSQPAACLYRGKRLNGFITHEDGNLIFVPYNSELKAINHG